MAHALAAFIREQMDERKLRNRDIVRDSGLSRALVSKYVNDKRDTLTRLPERDTLAGLATALHVSPEFLFGKAIESLGLGYTSGDFVNSVATATDGELLDQIEKRLQKRGEEHDRGSAPIAFPSRDEPESQTVLNAARPGLSEAEREAATEAMQRKLQEQADKDADNSADGEDSA